MGKLKTLWHISPKENVSSILEKGILPSMSTGKYKRSWYVKWWGICWAIVHISLKKRIPAWQLVCFKVSINEDYLTHFNRNVYTCKQVVKAKEFLSAEQAMSRWERQRVGMGQRPTDSAIKRYGNETR